MLEVQGSRCLDARHGITGHLGMLELHWIAADSGLQAWAVDAQGPERHGGVAGWAGCHFCLLPGP